MSASLFLSAKWQHLLMVNYVIDAHVLSSLIPEGTELDLWNGQAYVSLVGFMFRDTAVWGFSFPFHTTFEEVNLRFYVKQKTETGDLRGVVFIKEIVPRRAIAWAARELYNENYVSLPMRHRIEKREDLVSVGYEWNLGGTWHKFEASASPELIAIEPLSEAEFITEHYYGYTVQKDGGTLCYEVKHPRWQTFPVQEHRVSVDFERVYGPAFAKLSSAEPASVILAQGSAIEVYKGIPLKPVKS